MITIATEQEVDGRWLAEVSELPGCLAYGDTRDAAIAATESLALRIIADRIDHGEPLPAGIDHLFLASA